MSTTKAMTYNRWNNLRTFEGRRGRLRPGELDHLLPDPPESLDFDSWDSRVNMLYNIQVST